MGDAPIPVEQGGADAATDSATTGDGAVSADGESSADGGTTGDAQSGNDASAAAPGAPSGVTAAAVPVVTTVSTLAGSPTGASGLVDDTGALAKFAEPTGLAVDALGNVYVADTGNHTIRKVTPAGVVTTLAGSGASGFVDGTGTGAKFSVPLGVAVDASRNVYVADGGNQRIRKIAANTVVSTLAGSGTAAFADGTGAAASFSGPGAVAVDPQGNVYVVDTTNQRIRFVTPTGEVSTIAGSGSASFADGTGALAGFRYPSGVAVDGGEAWVIDSANQRLRKITNTGVVTTLAGGSTFGYVDGAGSVARFNSPQAVALDGARNAYIADQDNHRIRKVTPAGVVSTLAGSGVPSFNDGLAAVAEFNNPAGIVVDAADVVYVSDKNNHRIRKIVSAGIRQVTVTWTAPASAGSSAITGYTATATATSQTPQTCTTTGATTCTLNGLARGVPYTVTITATNAAGTSAPSAAANATPN